MRGDVGVREAQPVGRRGALEHASGAVDPDRLRRADSLVQRAGELAGRAAEVYDGIALDRLRRREQVPERLPAFAADRG